MYADSSSHKCTRCSTGCSTCNESGDDKCTSCPIRTHFLDDSGSGSGRCVECGDTTNSKGIAGCRECNSEGGSVRCLVCRPGHVLVDDKCQPRCQDPTNCAEGSCVVGVGENLYCRLCKTSGYAPVDGICTDIAGTNPSGCVSGADPDSARRCLQCGAGYFLYMGGCYKGDTPVGKSVCTWAGVDGPITRTNYGPGLCNVCAKGYENQEGVCRPCTTSKCDQCRTVDQVEVCTHCTLGYVMDRAGACSIQTIGSCTVPDCAACADDGKCQRCGRGFFLTSAGTCVDNCKVIPGYYAVKNVETMVARCAPCEIPNCKVCSTDVLCAVCEDGYFSGNKGCVRCSSECTTCVGDGAEDCTSCPPGYAVTSESRVGRCEKPCTPSTAGCKGCDADIDGASYCSVCSAQAAFPLNGRCTEPSARAASACISIFDGTCTRCADGYFLLSGGCYQVDTYPGRTVCRAEEHGVCTKGAHGNMVSPSGVLQDCPVTHCAECTVDACALCKVGYVSVENRCQRCAQGCVACAAPNDPQMCTLCDRGYYQSTAGPAFTCTPCSASNNGVTGVPGCTHCEPPGGMVGPVLCYTFDAVPSVVPPEPSPPRRIALVVGVSVTVALLVAGLVGFLLWWFLCRHTHPHQVYSASAECVRHRLIE
ncbi:Variant-specific surface protein [Giardia duodenalis]|uniref:Variant-specific surface protein n=1 Tax=Giardia intestinalis TaxID=5741 RepID=V6TS64_GIAIN|nr:Variant-specific surface protein [Giardia intestinalis]